jgi:hypothetical protein
MHEVEKRYSDSSRPSRHVRGDSDHAVVEDDFQCANPRHRTGIPKGTIHGAHIVIFSKKPEADRAFFRDVLEYPSVDAGHGWLIFALPPAELAVHPDEQGDRHELFLMCDDLRVFMARMAAAHVACSAVEELRWGSLVRVSLPGGDAIGVYQPKHPSPEHPE